RLRDAAVHAVARRYPADGRLHGQVLALQLGDRRRLLLARGDRRPQQRRLPLLLRARRRLHVLEEGNDRLGAESDAGARGRDGDRMVVRAHAGRLARHRAAPDVDLLAVRLRGGRPKRVSNGVACAASGRILVPLVIEPDPMLRRIERRAMLSCAIMALGAWAIARGRVDAPLGVLGGGALVWISYRGIKSGVDALGDRTTSRVRVAVGLVKFF